MHDENKAWINIYMSRMNYVRLIDFYELHYWLIESLWNPLVFMSQVRIFVHLQVK